MSRLFLFTMLGGCASSELLPLVDADGALAGSYDPSAAALSVDSDAAAAELSTGQRVSLDAGGAAQVDALVPGDALTLLDADDQVVEVLVVADPDTSFEVESRYGSCVPLVPDDGT